MHKGKDNNSHEPGNKKKKFFVVSTHQRDWSYPEFFAFEKKGIVHNISYLDLKKRN